MPLQKKHMHPKDKNKAHKFIFGKHADFQNQNLGVKFIIEHEELKLQCAKMHQERPQTRSWMRTKVTITYINNERDVSVKNVFKDLYASVTIPITSVSLIPTASVSSAPTTSTASVTCIHDYVQYLTFDWFPCIVNRMLEVNKNQIDIKNIFDCNAVLEYEYSTK